jgi:hypothetical protein
MTIIQQPVPSDFKMNNQLVSAKETLPSICRRIV